MRNLSNCPHCQCQPTKSRILDDTVIACLDHDLVAQAGSNDEAAAMWEFIVDIRINAKNLTNEVPA